MSEYIVEIAGNLNLAQITLAIDGEEATGSEFIKSSLSYHENKITNLATFKDLPIGHVPAQQVVLVKHGDPTPGGKKAIWAGVMLVSGNNMATTACR